MSLTVGAGEFVGLLGVANEGKTRLLEVAAGLAVPEAGEVWFEGRALARCSEDDRTELLGIASLGCRSESTSTSSMQRTGATSVEPNWRRFTVETLLKRQVAGGRNGSALLIRHTVEGPRIEYRSIFKASHPEPDRSLHHRVDSFSRM